MTNREHDDQIVLRYGSLIMLLIALGGALCLMK